MKMIEQQAAGSDNAQGFREPPRSLRGPTILGLAVLAFAVGGLGVWGSAVPLASAVVSQGEVIVASRRKEVQHLSGGTVKSIRVKDGANVKAGEILVELDPEKAHRQHELTRSAYFANLAAKSRIVAERDDAANVVFSKELNSAGDADPDIAALLGTQKRLFQTKRREFHGQRELLDQRKRQLADEIAGLTAEQTSINKQIGLANRELAILKQLLKKGHATRHRVLTFEREIARLEGSLGRIAGKISKSRKEVVSIEMQILQLAKQRNKETAAELRDTEQRLLDSRERYLAAKADLTRLKILSPVDGTIVGLRVHTIGGVIRPGETVLEIVPAADKLIVEARIRPLDIDNISVGQQTTVRLTALKQRNMPQLDGRVVYVSADRTKDNRTGETHYVAQVAISPGAMSELGGENLVPGMPAEIYIKTGERTAIAYLMEPLVDSVHRAWRE
jgi:HlyD family type I secretion membrane fusion protein